jgi:hypothetical protein
MSIIDEKSFRVINDLEFYSLMEIIGNDTSRVLKWKIIPDEKSYQPTLLFLIKNESEHASSWPGYAMKLESSQVTP